jgi:FkbM family methyltransferase
MMEKILDFWGRSFARARFAKINGFLFQLGARGLGIHNYPESGEEWFVKTLAANARDTSCFVVFDVGANRGVYATLLRRSFPTAVIHCFEPHPRTFEILKSSTTELNLILHNFGLSHQSEELNLHDHAGHTDGEHATLYADVFESLNQTAYDSVRIALKTVDQFCSEEGVARVDFLKIDIEGHEIHCLRGAKEMIAAGRIDIAQFEFNKMNLCSRTFMTDFFDVLEGFQLYRLLPGSLLPLRRSDTLKTNLFEYQNVIAIRHGVPFGR